MKHFDIITIFPDVFRPYTNESILKRGQMKGVIDIKLHNLRDYTTDPHQTVDDRPYGGGPGMLLMFEPMYKALCDIRSKGAKNKTRVVMMSPNGKTFAHADAKRLAKYDQIILLCGRYEGFDARIEKFIDEKISIGDFVLSGGELPAMMVMEAVARQIPGVLGNAETLDEESFSLGTDYLEHPHYTRPEKFEVKNAKGKTQILSVPKVLLSGNHKLIKEWREKHGKRRKSK